MQAIVYKQLSILYCIFNMQIQYDHNYCKMLYGVISVNLATISIPIVIYGYFGMGC